MNPLIQLNRQLQYLFIALLLACFAIAQSAMAQQPDPNHRVINLNFTVGPIQCSFMDKVPIRGQLNIFFERNGNGKVVPRTVREGDKQFLPNDALELSNAVGSNSHRTYTGRVQVKDVFTSRPNDNFMTLLIQLTANPNPPGQADPDPNVPKTGFSIKDHPVGWAYENGKVKEHGFLPGRPEFCGCGAGCKKL